MIILCAVSFFLDGLEITLSSYPGKLLVKAPSYLLNIDIEMGKIGLKHAPRTAESKIIPTIPLVNVSPRGPEDMHLKILFPLVRGWASTEDASHGCEAVASPWYTKDRPGDYCCISSMKWLLLHVS